MKTTTTVFKVLSNKTQKTQPCVKK